MTLPIGVRSAAADDANAIADIYNHYIAETVITFEEQPLQGAEMATRIAATLALFLPWLVAEREGRVIGYAYAGRWKARSAYRHTVEVTIYLAPDAVGGGVGSALYRSLFEQLRALGMHTAIGGIALPNAASVALHEKFGMTQVGHFRELGYKFGRWVDVGYWSCIL